MTEPTTEVPPNVPPMDEIQHVAELLAAGASVAVVSSALAGLAGVGAQAVTAMFQIDTMVSLVDLPGPTGAGHLSVVNRQHISNLQRRAAYLINAGRRLGTAVVREKAQPGSIQAAMTRERGLLRQHLEATRLRNEAAGRVQDEYDKVSAQRQTENRAKRAAGQESTLGLLAKSRNIELGWYTVLDKRTSPECRAADGKNFDPLQPPTIGLPGTVHPRCRCLPGPPHPTNQRVGGPDMKRSTQDRYKRQLVSLARTEVDSHSLPDIPNKPGKTNWVEKAGGLPSYIKRIAKHLQANGHSTGSAIATAVNTVRRWAAGGTVTAHGGPKVSAKTQALAAAAYAEWKAKAASAGGKH